MATIDIQIKVIDAFGDGFGGNSAILYIKNPDSSTFTSFYNQEQETQIFTSSVTKDRLYYIFFENATNLNETSVELSLQNNQVIALPINIPSLIENNFKMYFVISDNSIETQLNDNDFDNINVFTLSQDPYNMNINSLYYKNDTNNNFYRFGYVINVTEIKPTYDTKLSFFGKSIVKHNNLIVIGDPGYDLNTNENAGCLNLYNNNQNKWEPSSNPIITLPPEINTINNFGYSVSMNETHIIVGALNSANAYLYNRNNLSNYILLNGPTTNNNVTHFGNSISLFNNVIAISASNYLSNGRVFLYDINELNLQNSQELDYNYELIPNDNDWFTDMFFGHEVKVMNNDCMITAYRHNNKGCAYYFLYDSSSNTWEEKQQIIPNDLINGSNFGITMDMNNNYAIFGCFNDIYTVNDKIYIYKKDDNNYWNTYQELNVNSYTNNFGYTLSINNNYILVGLGKQLSDTFAYLYKYDTTNDNFTLNREIQYNDDNISSSLSYSSFVKLADDNSMIINIRSHEIQNDIENYTYIYDNIDYFNYYTVEEAINIGRLNAYDSLLNEFKISNYQNTNDFELCIQLNFIKIIGFITNDISNELGLSDSDFPIVIFKDNNTNQIIKSKYTYQPHNINETQVSNDELSINELLDSINEIINTSDNKLDIYEIESEIDDSYINTVSIINAIRQSITDEENKANIISQFNFISNLLVNIDDAINNNDIYVYDAIDLGNITFDYALNNDYTNLDELKTLIDDNSNKYTMYFVVEENRWLNKEQLTIMGYQLRELLFDYGIPYSTLTGLGYIWSATSGDPHIFPCYGNKYELPQMPGIFRMLQGKKIILNASTRYTSVEEQNDIIKYFSNMYNKQYQKYKKDIVYNGSFYNDIFLKSDNCSLKFNFDNKKIKFENHESLKYFTIKTNVLRNNDYTNIYEKCENINQIIISFTNSYHGAISICINYFSNPQIKYGISFISNNYNNIQGLLIREYNISKLTLKKLTDCKNKKCKIYKNPIKTYFCKT